MSLLVVDISDRKFDPCTGNLPTGEPGLVITPAAAEICDSADILRITNEHYTLNDESDAEDSAANEQALKTGARIFTKHTVKGSTVWLITEQSLPPKAPTDRTDRPCTILTPSDY